MTDVDDQFPGDEMPDEQLPLSFADPRTHFWLPRGDNGRNEPSGIVVCAACGEQAENVDEIPHDPDCPQRFVHSKFYVNHTSREY